MLRRKSKRPIQKKFYLLLEVLVALTLVLTLLVPLLKPLYGIRKIEIQFCEHDDLERASRFMMSEIKAALHENKISWDELSVGCLRDKGEVRIGNKCYHSHYTLKPIDSHTKTSSPHKFLLIECTVIFTAKQSTSFTKTWMIEKRGIK